MFVARYVVDALPLPGTILTMAIKLPTSKNYTALLRRITYSLSYGHQRLAVGDPDPPLIELAIQSQNDVQVREGGQTYIGGIAIQPNLVYLATGETNYNVFNLPVWGQRLFLALEQRYVPTESQLVVSCTNYEGLDTMGLRIEYTQEKLSDLEYSQMGLR